MKKDCEIKENTHAYKYVKAIKSTSSWQCLGREQITFAKQNFFPICWFSLFLFFNLCRVFLFYGNVIIHSFSSLLTLQNLCWLNCRIATKTYIKHTKWLAVLQKNWKIIKMTLIMNFNIDMTLLPDKRKYWQWAQTATFIKMLEQIQTKHWERWTNIIRENHNDIILK